MPPTHLLLTALLLLSTVGGATPAARTWQWPLPSSGGPPEVVRAFDRPDQPWLAGHRGVDLAAGKGTPVLAPRAGRVSFSGPVAGREVLVIDHPNGLRSSFEPVTDGLPVGTVVGAGDRVATLAGADGREAGPAAYVGHCLPRDCLHWGVRRDSTYLDPLRLVRGVTVRLLPL